MAYPPTPMVNWIAGWSRRVSWLIVIMAVSPSAWGLPAGLFARMPSVEQVEAKVHGSSPNDTMARQALALKVLYGVFIQTGAGGFGRPSTPAEVKLSEAYLKESQRLASRIPPTAFVPYEDDHKITTGYRDEVLELFGLKDAVDEARAAADGASDAAGSGQRKSAFNSPVLPAVGMLGLGILMSLGALSGMAKVQRQNRDIRKEAFERRNASGVLEFRTFEEAERFRQRKPNSDMAGCLLVVILLAGAGLAVIGGGVLYASLTGWHM